MAPPSSEPGAPAEAWPRAYGGRAGSEAATALPDSLPVGPARGASDCRAAWLRWHPPGPPAAPGDGQGPWLEILERARVETLASGHLPGMAANLSDTAGLAPSPVACAQLYRAARAVFAGHPATGPVLPEPLPSADRNAGPELRTSLLAWLRPRRARPVPPPVQAAPMSDAQALTILAAAGACLADPGRFREALTPLLDWLARQAPARPEHSRCDLPLPSPDALDGERDGESIPTEDLAAPPRPGPGGGAAPGPPGGDYRAYSTQWDETLPAAHYFEAIDAENLRALDAGQRAGIRKFAHRLQRRLMGAQLRSWDFDQEHGRLDSRRLARLLVPASSPTVFRQERLAPMPDTCVSLLVDQSGSMQGNRRQMAALAIDLLIHTLETCGIKTELLGFTTRYGADNPLVRDWRSCGQGAGPGRLNALRHILYKTAAQPWRRCRPYLGLLLRDAFGHENIDGEALDWAARRLANRPEPRRILIVLSDGAPYDTATQLAQDRAYLENHLHRVIAAIEASPIRLVGIGTGRDVARFYRHSLTLHTPEQVAPGLFEYLGDLLTQPSPGNSGSP